MSTLLSIIIAIAAIVVIVVVAQMESEQAGLGTLSGASDTSMWGQYKGSSKKELMNRVVIGGAVVFAVALLVLAAIH